MEQNPLHNSAVEELQKYLNRATWFYDTLILTFKSRWGINLMAASVGKRARGHLLYAALII